MGLVDALLQARTIANERSQASDDRTDALLLTLQESFDVLEQTVERLNEAVIALDHRVTALEGG